MGKLVSQYPIKLNVGADGAELERLIRDDIAPLCAQLGQTMYLMKGNKGTHAGRYVLVIEMESAAERDRVYPFVDGELIIPEDVLRVFDQGGSAWEKLVTLIAAFPSAEWTDYEVLD
jgi:hypothetical protein